MLIAPENFSGIDQNEFKKTQINHYQKTYKDAFFFNCIEEEIKK
jgi:hypothetical protein